MSQFLQPTAGAQPDVIVPGPVRGACPPPTEIVCIDAKKVFDFCFQEETLDRCFLLDEEVTEILDCQIENVQCQELRNRQPIEGQEGLFLVSLRIDLMLRITLVIDEKEVDRFRQISFVKQVVLCAPNGTQVECEVNGTCICVLQEQMLGPGQEALPVDDEPNICCTIQLCITVQSFAKVKLLVPTFCLCMPSECQVSPIFGGCPPMPPAQCFPETLNGNAVSPIFKGRKIKNRKCGNC